MSGSPSEIAATDLAANPGAGTVYTETVVFSPPVAFVHDVPYQMAIVALDSGRRLTGRILGERVAIDDRVLFAGFRGGIPYFRKAS